MSVLDTLTSRTVAFFGQARPANIQVLSVSPTRPGAAGAADWAGAGDGDGGVPGVTAVVRFSRTAHGVGGAPPPPLPPPVLSGHAASLTPY